jgi:hypothetical protein
MRKTGAGQAVRVVQLGVGVSSRRAEMQPVSVGQRLQSTTAEEIRPDA